MAIGKRLLLFSARDPKAASLQAATAPWGCLTTACESFDELRGRIEGADLDMVLVEPSSAIRKVLASSTDEEVLKLPLAEVEKRHIMRVLASTSGNNSTSCPTRSASSFPAPSFCNCSATKLFPDATPPSKPMIRG